MKDHLIFDATSAATILDSDSIGAFLRASDGTLLTHTDISGKKALDVNIAAGLNVEVDLSHVDDSVRLGDGTAFFTSTSENGDIALDVHISNTSIVVTATDLDIRDLAFASDSVTTHQGGTWNIATVTTLTGITNDVNIADGGNSITVDGTVGLSEDHNYGAVGASTLRTAAQIGNSSGAADFGSGATSAQTLRVALATDTSFNVNDAALANSAILSAADTLAVAGTAEKVVASNLALRKYLFVRNNDNRVMYVGGAGVSAANGFPVSPGSAIELRAGAAVDVYYDSDKAGHAIRTLELS